MCEAAFDNNLEEIKRLVLRLPPYAYHPTPTTLRLPPYTAVLLYWPRGYSRTDEAADTPVLQADILVLREILRYQVSNGVNVDDADYDGRTALHLAGSFARIRPL
eukprot:379793-Rhodomonas_salina.1